MVERALTARRDLGPIRLRTVSEDDQAAIIPVFQDWWDEPPYPKLERLWFRHWASTSAVAEDTAGRRAGLLIGFVSPDIPSEAVIRLLAVAGWARRRGIGRSLVERFALVAAERGADRIVVGVAPGDPGPLAFLRALGFVAVALPGTRSLYGVPAVADAGGRGEDLAFFERPMRQAGRAIST